MTVKKWFMYIRIIVLLCILTSTITPVQNIVMASNTVILEGMEKVCENERFELYLNFETTVFTIFDKESRRLLFSTPENYKNDPLANKRYKDIMSSNILVTYVNEGGEKTISSAGNAVEFGQFEITMIENGFRIEYIISESLIDELAIPLVMPYTFIHDRLLPRLNTDEGNELLQNYVIISVKDPIIKNYVKRHRIKMYPFIVEEDIYVLIPTRRSALNREIIRMLLEKAEVTPDEIIALNSKYYDHTSVEKNPNFRLVLNITINNHGLCAEVDMSEIEYDAFSAELKSVTLLPYFGAANINETGYVLLPDGSGAIMKFDPNQALYTPITLPIYGGQETGTNTEAAPVRQPVTLNAFGIVYNNTGFAAVVSDGDAVSLIEAGLGGLNTSYNYVCSQFIYNDYYMLENPMNLIRNPETGNNPYKGKASVQFMFLDEERSDYSGIASKVRIYLEDTGILTRKISTIAPPVTLEIVGAVPVTKKFLGITYKSYEALTSYEKAEEILDTLYQAGIDQMNVRLLGWTKGGVLQKYPLNFNPIKSLGGRKDFFKLVNTANKLGFIIYPDISITKIYTNSLIALINGVYDLKGSPKLVYRYNQITQGANGNYPGYYLLRPIKWPNIFITLRQKVESIGLKSISLSDFGYQLYTDNRKNSYNRQTSLSIAVNEINLLHDKNILIMGQYGNVHVVDQFDVITDIAMENSGFVAALESVPFLQMVISGYTDYYGTPINKSENSRLMFLKNIEYGASGIKYFLTAADNTKVWEIQWNQYRNTLFSRYVNEIADFYISMKEFTQKKSGSVMIDHKNIAPNVYMTTYDNGVYTIVNYNEQAVTVNEITIDALDYVIREG